MTRRSTSFAGIIILLTLVCADFIRFQPNPYQQPAVFALGSGGPSAGGFCGALPTR